MSFVFAAILPAAVALWLPPVDLPPVVPEFGPKLENYYRKTDPKIAEEFLAELLKPENIDHKWFNEHADVLDIMGTQLGDLANGHEELVRRYEDAFPRARLKGKQVIVAALKVCGDETSQKVVAGWLSDSTHKDLKNDLEVLHK